MRNFFTAYQRTPPTRPSILRWIRKFELPGNVENKNASGRHPVSQQTIQTVLKYFKSNPSRSLTRVALDLHLPRSTIYYVLRRKIHMLPYKIRLVQQLSQQDLTERTQFATWCFDSMHSNSKFLLRIVFSDECVFLISGIANNQSARF